MKKNNLISVIINCRNSQKYIKETIDSVINQTYKNFEIIIVNNNSTDNTKNIIFSYSDQRIKYFELNKSISLGAARNIALKESSGEFIAFIDSDDIWDKSKIEQTLKEFQNNIGLVYSDVVYFNSEKSFNLYKGRKAYEGNCFSSLLTDYNLCISSCVISRKYMNQFLFDENLNVCEDLDFFLKISYKSKLKYVPKTLVKYRIHGSNLSITNQHMFYEEFKIVLKNLQQKFNIENKLIIKMEDINYINYAKFFWKNRKIKESFTELKKIKTLHFKALVYKLIILVPYRFVNKIYRIISPVKIELTN